MRRRRMKGANVDVEKISSMIFAPTKTVGMQCYTDDKEKVANGLSARIYLIFQFQTIAMRDAGT